MTRVNAYNYQCIAENSSMGSCTPCKKRESKASMNKTSKLLSTSAKRIWHSSYGEVELERVR